MLQSQLGSGPRGKVVHSFLAGYTINVMGKTLPKPLRGSSGAGEIYEHLIASLKSLGKFDVEEKKTCLHLKGRRAAFLGIHPRKEGLRLNIVLSRPLKGARIVKSDQVSKSRYHNEVDLKSVAELDGEFETWLREAYELQTAG